MLVADEPRGLTFCSGKSTSQVVLVLIYKLEGGLYGKSSSNAHMIAFHCHQIV